MINYHKIRNFITISDESSDGRKKSALYKINSNPNLKRSSKEELRKPKLK
jgi:hypothetical protein